MQEFMKIRQLVFDSIRKKPMSTDKLMSERELSDKFGVARSTVRYALKGLIEDGYIYSKHGSGMYINQEKVRNYAYAYRKFYTVVVIIANGRHVDFDGFYMAMLENIFHTFRSKPINARVMDIDLSDIAAAAKELSLCEVDAVLWVWPDNQGWEVIEKLDEDTLLYVIGDEKSGRKCHVSLDCYRGGVIAAEWFIKNKKKNFGLIGADRNSRARNRFLQGWNDTRKTRGLLFDEELIVNIDERIPARVHDLLINKKVEGLYSFGSDYVIIDSIMNEEGITPKQCPVILEDNFYGDYGVVNQPAARLSNFIEEMAKTAAMHLHKSLYETEHKPEEIVFKPEILP